MDRNRLLWKKDQMARVKKRFLAGLVVIVNRLLETLVRQPPPENIQRNIIQKVSLHIVLNSFWGWGLCMLSDSPFRSRRTLEPSPYWISPPIALVSEAQHPATELRLESVS